VDNRAVLASTHAFNTYAIRQFILPQFYGGRIILEEEQEWTFLGFDIDLVQRRVKFDFKLAQESFISIPSATPPRVILSGVLARAAMIRRCSFPQEQARDDLRTLLSFASAFGIEVSRTLRRRHFTVR
jgi:hypothetical protein